MTARFQLLLCALAGTAFGAAGSAVLHAESSVPPAFLIGENDVHNVETFKTYASQVPTTLVAYGGHFLAAGGRTQALEGLAPPNTFVILQFPSMDKAKAWYNSPEYQKILPLRRAAANSRVYLAEGKSVVSRSWWKLT